MLTLHLPKAQAVKTGSADGYASRGKLETISILDTADVLNFHDATAMEEAAWRWTRLNIWRK